MKQMNDIKLIITLPHINVATYKALKFLGYKIILKRKLRRYQWC